MRSTAKREAGVGIGVPCVFVSRCRLEVGRWRVIRRKRGPNKLEHYPRPVPLTSGFRRRGKWSRSMRFEGPDRNRPRPAATITAAKRKSSLQTRETNRRPCYRTGSSIAISKRRVWF